jgi:hypothetical protein
VQCNAKIKEQYQVNILNRFAALDDLGDNVDINRAWENVRLNIKISAQTSLTNNVQNYWIKEYTVNCSGCKILAK